jgi:mono/diheme cytochrome c family protein
MKSLDPVAAFLTLTLVAGSSAQAEDYTDARLARGAYLAQIMDCGGCHTPRGATGVPIADAGLSGGTVGFEIPGLATFWPPNLTQHPTGLAGWSEADIVTAIRTGVRPDGRVLAPAMPSISFSRLTDEDAQALAAYLLSLPGMANKVPDPLAAGEPAQLPFYRVTLP